MTSSFLGAGPPMTNSFFLGAPPMTSSLLGCVRGGRGALEELRGAAAGGAPGGGAHRPPAPLGRLRGLNAKAFGLNAGAAAVSFLSPAGGRRGEG